MVASTTTASGRSPPIRHRSPTSGVADLDAFHREVLAEPSRRDRVPELDLPVHDVLAGERVERLVASAVVLRVHLPVADHAERRDLAPGRQRVACRSPSGRHRAAGVGWSSATTFTASSRPTSVKHPVTLTRRPRQTGAMERPAARRGPWRVGRALVLGLAVLGGLPRAATPSAGAGRRPTTTSATAPAPSDSPTTTRGPSRRHGSTAATTPATGAGRSSPRRSPRSTPSDWASPGDPSARSPRVSCGWSRSRTRRSTAPRPPAS